MPRGGIQELAHQEAIRAQEKDYRDWRANSAARRILNIPRSLDLPETLTTANFNHQEHDHHDLLKGYGYGYGSGMDFS